MRPFTTNPRNSTHLGMVRELLVAADLTHRGYEVFRALSSGASCDLIAIQDGRVFRVEVTTARQWKNGQLKWPYHDPARYDLLALYVADRGIIYIPDITSSADNSIEGK